MPKILGIDIPASLPAGTSDPSVFHPDGTTYYNTTTNMLRVLEAGAWSDVGGGGSSGIIKARLHDGASTTLTTGTPVTIDGSLVVNNDLVLYTALSSGNNKIYKATVVAGNVTAWATQAVFTGIDTPVNGDQVYIQEGTFYSKNILLFTGTTYENLLNQKTLLTLNDNVSNVSFLAFDTTDFKFFMMEYSIDRGASGIRTGIFSVCSDGTTINSQDLGLAVVGADGVTLDAIQVGTIMRLRYSTTNAGLNATLKRTARVW